METSTPNAPIVHLINAFHQPYDNAVATARTCYSSRVISTEEVSRDEKARKLRDEIASSTYEAGHHTTLQHATFQFTLERVSRQMIWSFLHSHPFYNSEQVSQRYVAVKPDTYFVPPLPSNALEIYHATCQLQMEGYHKLNELLWNDTKEAFFKIFPARRKTEEQWASSIKKKVQEISRYVLPVATYAHLYHTVSGLTLHRYHRLMQSFDTPFEQRQVIEQMCNAIVAIDPLFLKHADDALALEKTPEYAFFVSLDEKRKNTSSFIREFDQDLGNQCSKLVDYKVNAEATLAQSIRDVFGVVKSEMSDEEAIERVLSPVYNTYLAERLNLNAHTKLSRTLSHVHYTFRKKLSHTADSQDQRHRMTPGSRPILESHFQADQPDFITPPIVANNAQANDYYVSLMNQTWKNISRLLEMGVSHEFALYLLPNAFPIRFEESGDLLNLHHKWTSRLCYTAQEEIWNACREEVLQVSEIHPKLAKHLLPPCGLRDEAQKTPICPEGKRFCGVPVWKLKRENYVRTL